MNRATVLTLALVVIGLVFPGIEPTAANGRAPRLLVWETAIRGDQEHELRWPVGVAAASNDEIAVADAYGSRLVIFKQLKGIWNVDRAVALPGSPLDIAHDGIRYVLSLRSGAGLVAAEGPQHQLRSISLPAGSVPGTVAAQRGGGFLIHDSAGNRILSLGPEASLTGQTPVAGNPTALASAPGGGFYAAFADLGTVRRYSLAGEVLESFQVPGEEPVPAWPTGIAALPGGAVVVVDRHGGRIVVLDAKGRLQGVGSRRGWDPGLLLFPAGIAALPDGRLAVADQGNGRIQIFRRLKAGSTP
jgi:DNA-binding beta-propeller fold protein YncE